MLSTPRPGRAVGRPVGAPWQPGDARSRPAAAPVERDELRVVRQGYCGLVIGAAALQVLFFYGEPNNLLSTALALVSSLLGITFALNGRRFRAQPISALILLFYTTTATSGALLVKTLERTPLVDRLLLPQTTFAVLLGTQLALLLADRLYMRAPPLQSARRFVARRVLLPLGVMRWPNDTQLWLLGLLGCASVMLTGTDYESGASFGMASAGAKLIRAFGFLKFAPFLIPFRDGLSGVPSRVRIPVLPLAVYFGALVVISFATNSRSTFADAVPTVGVCLLMATALGRVDWRRMPPSRLIVFAVVALVGAALLSRVALAMVVVRDYRYSVDVGTLVRMTVEALMNDDWLQSAKAKMDTSVYMGNYSETYVDSRFLARFLLTKFHDNILYYFSLMGPDQLASYKAFMVERFAATLPDPLLRQFGIAIDKMELVVSNGDYVIYLVDGWGLGGFKTGSMITEVFAVFRWAFPLVIAASALLLFVAHDAFATPSPYGRLAVSPLILLLIWNLVGTTAAFGLGAETVTAVPSGVIRGLPQNLLFYLIAITAVRGVSRLLGKGS